MELLVTYRKTVFNALSDTESAFGQVTSFQEQERLVTIQEQNAAEAYRIAELQYREGVTDLLKDLPSDKKPAKPKGSLLGKDFLKGLSADKAPGKGSAPRASAVSAQSMAGLVATMHAFTAGTDTGSALFHHGSTAR